MFLLCKYRVKFASKFNFSALLSCARAFCSIIVKMYIFLLAGPGGGWGICSAPTRPTLVPGTRLSRVNSQAAILDLEAAMSAAM